MMLNKSCIFIDNDPYSQAIFARALNDVSPETICFTAGNGPDALYMMTEEKVIPSYIFVELNLPAMDGIEFLKTIKNIRQLKDIPVIVHSTGPPPHKVIEIREAGAMAIYLRPYEYTGVCNMLQLCFGVHLIQN